MQPQLPNRLWRAVQYLAVAYAVALLIKLLLRLTGRM